MESRKYTDYRKRTYSNLHLFEGVAIDGDYDMPRIEPFDGEIPSRFIPFNKARTERDCNCGVHFYIDDYQFERVWRQPEKYAAMLKRFQCVTAPDFSLYVDAPKAVNIWNVYRSRLLASYFQRCGIKVLPSASCGNPDSLSFCFDGLPENSIISVGCVAKGRNVKVERLLRYWFDQLIITKHPNTVLVYGRNIFPDRTDTNIVYIEDHINKLKSYGKDRKTRTTRL